ncbi:MAG: 4-alpha-glucanotransferase [Paludibacteraceae bacterium]|nr:4-alpha-glucanotransferase [Paludibacteraceae bacterium]
MNLTFEINYRTEFGQTLCIIQTQESIAGWTEQTPLRMNCQGQDFWTVGVTVSDFIREIHYKYAILLENGWFIYETGEERILRLNAEKESWIIRDFWQSIEEERSFDTLAFTKAVFRRKTDISTRNEDGNVRFSIDLPQILPTQGVAILGNTPELGNWNPKGKLILSDHDFPLWRGVINTRPGQVIEYKYCIYDHATGEIVDLEWGENRQIWGFKPGMRVMQNDRVFRRTQPRWKGSGVAIPVFSLRSKNDFGIGEFADLCPLADWAAKTGMKIIQTLPINDTTITHTDRDSYPYKSVSVFALHPIYINVEQAGQLNSTLLKRYRKEQKAFNALEYADYQKVYNAKMRYLKALYESDYEQLKETDEFRSFVTKNEQWLFPYADFMHRRDRLPRNFYIYLQYHADSQLKKAVDHAHQLGIALKGDIPIGVAADSVDVNQHPSLFHTDVSAGAPPDAFAEKGQIWGFPTYDWDAMSKDGYQWWQQRFQKMQDYFDAYRIDHILGFFRIWQVPRTAKTGLEGQFQPALPYTRDELKMLTDEELESFFIQDYKEKQHYHPKIAIHKEKGFHTLGQEKKKLLTELHDDYFYHRHNDFWKESALRKLPALIRSTKMLCCGEDLGMIPDCVPQVMHDLHILSLEVQRMPKYPGKAFARPSDAPYLSVCTTGTHDTSTLRMWWKENWKLTRQFYQEQLDMKGRIPHDLTPETAERIIKQFMYSQAMWVILPWQDWMSIDGRLRKDDASGERINIPSDPNQIWNYRMHLDIEQLLEEEALNLHIQQLTALR